MNKNEKFHWRIEVVLSTFPEKTVLQDGTVLSRDIPNPYFLKEVKWNVHFLGGIPQFKEQVTSYKGTKKNVYFRFNNDALNLEMKYLYYQNLFQDYWKVSTIFGSKQAPLKRLTEFINEKFPALSSFTELTIDETEEQYLVWLNNKGIATTAVKENILYRALTVSTNTVAFLRIVYNAILDYTDERNEWEKDRWNIRNLHKTYGVDYNKAITGYRLDFSTIDERVRGIIKRYLKQRLLSKTLSWSTAVNYHTALSNFFSFLFKLHPEWNSLSDFQRIDMEKYLEHLHEFAYKKDRHSNPHPELYISHTLTNVQKFLKDIQHFEYDEAPRLDHRLLVYKEDFPKVRRKSYGCIQHIPDYVLNQLFEHLDDLHSDIVPVIWIAFKTGLRISDVLHLKVDCLKYSGGNYSIVTDIRKTYVKDHHLPTDGHVASILSTLIEKSKTESNNENNPDQFIFIRHRGRRKGHPMSQHFVGKGLNEWAVRNAIMDENGETFHFKLHQFRHTFAVKMINGGADLRIIQELLAHASPESTVRYAKLNDGMKRKAFDAVFREYGL